MQRLKKAIQMYRQHGSRFVLHRAVFRFEYERFERRRAVRDFRSKKPGTATVRYLDQEFELHPSGRGLSEEMALFGSHEPVSTAVYLRHLGEGDHVLDVGSNLGYYLLLAAQAVGPSGRVLGFEPASDVYAILERNVARSGRKNIQVFPWAVGAQNGTAEFYESEIPNWGSLMQQDRLLPGRTTTVQVKQLDSVLDDFPGFRPNVLRMDVEGGELTVLDGAQRILREYRPALFIEFHAHLLGWEPVRESVAKLCEMGYSSGTLIDREFDYPWLSSWARERHCWSGAVCNLLSRFESCRDSLDPGVFSIISKAT